MHQTRTTTQGVKFFDVILALKHILEVTTQLPDRQVRVWFGAGRPALAGNDVYVWFRPTVDDVKPTPGPQEFGNQADCKFEIHLVTRNFVDEAQIDMRRAEEYYDYYWRILITLHNHNLFPKYVIPAPNTISGDQYIRPPWFQPEPDGKSPPLTVGTMLMESLAVPDKTQKEEGTIESAWTLSVPVVLAMYIP